LNTSALDDCIANAKGSTPIADLYTQIVSVRSALQPLLNN
jgi:hypothetical protein